MKLRDFLSYKDNCPCCNSELNISFLRSNKKQKIRFEDNNIKISIDLEYKRSLLAHYNIDLDSNLFYITFSSYDCFNNRNIDLNKCIPLTILKDFKEFQKNCNNFFIYKSCKKCQQYQYAANAKLNLKTCKVDDVSISSEMICIVKKQDDFYKRYIINNALEYKTSLISIDEIYEIIPKEIFYNANLKSIPIIAISGTNEYLMNKLDTLMLFY